MSRSLGTEKDWANLINILYQTDNVPGLYRTMSARKQRPCKKKNKTRKTTAMEISALSRCIAQQKEKKKRNE